MDEKKHVEYDSFLGLKYNIYYDKSNRQEEVIKERTEANTKYDSVNYSLRNKIPKIMLICILFVFIFGWFYYTTNQKAQQALKTYLYTVEKEAFYLN